MRNESAQNLDDVRIRSWILSSMYPTCSFFSLARTTTRTPRMVIKGDNRRRMCCFCKSTRSFALVSKRFVRFSSRERKSGMRGKKYNVTHRTSVQSHKNTKSCQNALLHTHAFSLNRDDTHRYVYCALFFAIIIDHRFLLNARAKNVRVYDAASSRSNEDDARHEVSRSLSVSDRVYYFVSHVQKRSERNFREKRDVFFRAQRHQLISYLRKLEKSIHTLKALFLLLNNFKWRSAAEEDSGARRTSRNPRSGKRRRRRSEEEEEEALHRVVREDSVPLPINKEVLEVCLVNRRVRWLEGLDSSNKPEVASWVDSGSRNNKPGASRRERVRFVNFAHRVF